MEAGAGGQCNVRSFGDEWIAFEVVIVAHLVDEVLAEWEGHGRLACNDVYSSAQAVAVRDDRDIVQRGDGADAKQFRGASAPLGIGLDYGKASCLQVTLDLPSSVEVLARGDGNGCAAMHNGEALNLFGVSRFFDPVWPVLFDLMGPLEHVILVPSAVGVEHE